MISNNRRECALSRVNKREIIVPVNINGPVMARKTCDRGGEKDEGGVFTANCKQHSLLVGSEKKGIGILGLSVRKKDW